MNGGRDKPEDFLEPTADEAPIPLEPCLVPLYPAGPIVGIRFPLGEGPYLVGADPGCDLHLPAEAGVAGRHAQLALSPAGPTVTPLDGSIFVGDQPPAGPLQSGDCLRLGRYLIRYLAGPDGHARYREELYQLKAFDPWTGLHGRRYLIDFLHRELFATRRSQRPLSLALLELDDLPRLAEKHGPLTAELAHRQVAARVRGSVRKSDLLAVAGPLQIAVCMYKSRPDDAVRLSERLRRCVAEEMLHDGDSRFEASLSVGIAMTRGEPPVTPEELLAQAESRLRQAQAEGGNRILH